MNYIYDYSHSDHDCTGEKYANTELLKCYFIWKWSMEKQGNTELNYLVILG